MNVRKLAALDIAFHGARLIFVEFGACVLLLPLFGVFVISRSLLLGVYMMFLGLNYLPLLTYAVIINQKKSARKEVALELSDPEQYRRKYGVQQLLLLVPLALPILSVAQELETYRKR